MYNYSVHDIPLSGFGGTENVRLKASAPGIEMCICVLRMLVIITSILQAHMRRVYERRKANGLAKCIYHILENCSSAVFDCFYICKVSRFQETQ